MYLTSEAIRFLMKDKENDLRKEEVATLNAYKASLDSATKFIPTWVKIAVAIALGLGTMIGLKRIVITVGEKIGKTHLTYAPILAAAQQGPHSCDIVKRRTPAWACRRSLMFILRHARACPGHPRLPLPPRRGWPGQARP
jgi:hypothetical protein